MPDPTAPPAGEEGVPTIPTPLPHFRKFTQREKKIFFNTLYVNTSR